MLAYSVEADADRRRPERGQGRRRRTAAALCARARRLHGRGERRSSTAKLSASDRRCVVRPPVAGGVARAGRRGSRRSKLRGIVLAGRHAPVLPAARARPRTCSASSAPTTRPRRRRVTSTTSSSAGENGRVLVQVDAASSRCSRRASSRRHVPGATLELTLDLQLQHIAERELQGRRRSESRARAARRSSWIRRPARSWRSPTIRRSIRTPSARSSDDERRNRAVAGRLRARLDVQDRDRVGGARRRRRHADGSHRHAVPATSRFPAASRSTTMHQYGVLSFEDVIVKSSNVGAIKADCGSASTG